MRDERVEKVEKVERVEKVESIDVMGNQRKSKSYDEFVDKFKPRHTTDDCFTPANVYAVVLDWASKKYGFDPSCVVRPFFPGGDYQAFDYAPDAVVLDNPPFSIISKIVKWYNDHGIRFFLFCPGLTAFCLIRDKASTVVSVGCTICFDNGAQVLVGFLTNMGGEVLFETAGGLNYFSVHHTPFKVKKSDAEFIRKLDCGSEFFGGGFLLSEKAAAEKAAAEKAAAEKAAAEKAAAEKAAAHVLKLSPREKKLQMGIGK